MTVCARMLWHGCGTIGAATSASERPPASHDSDKSWPGKTGRASARPAQENRSDVAKTYTLNFGTRLINGVFRTMTRLGLGASYRQILTVPGRKTGRPYSTPLDVIEAGGDQWLVAAYGPVNWVRNARAAGEVTLTRGGRTERYRIAEASPAEAVPVLRKYLTDVRVVRPYFDAAPDAPDEALEAELPRHPVLRLVPQSRPEER
jgi:deazaflavin-dependent oxidoreductase (nitroreductase family)